MPMLATVSVVGAILYCSILILSWYAGYSDKADIFCTGGENTPQTAVGPDGLVVLWLLTIIAHVTFLPDEYSKFMVAQRLEN